MRRFVLLVIANVFVYLQYILCVDDAIPLQHSPHFPVARTGNKEQQQQSDDIQSFVHSVCIYYMSSIDKQIWLTL